MTALITGATGFLGSRIAHSLLTSRRQRVITLGRGEPATLRARTVGALRACGAEVLDEQALGRLRCVSGDTRCRLLMEAPTVLAADAQFRVAWLVRHAVMTDEIALSITLSVWPRHWWPRSSSPTESWLTYGRSM